MRDLDLEQQWFNFLCATIAKVTELNLSSKVMKHRCPSTIRINLDNTC